MLEDERTKFKPFGKKVGSFVRQMPKQREEDVNILNAYPKRKAKIDSKISK